MTKILVTGDNAANPELVRFLLTATGHAVTVAHDGRKGLAAAQLELADLIISDLRMPGMDGHALVARLIDDSRPRGIPVIALTADSMPGDEEAMLRAGFDAYRSLPIEPEHRGPDRGHAALQVGATRLTSPAAACRQSPARPAVG